jgi:hypothetical protein
MRKGGSGEAWCGITARSARSDALFTVPMKAQGKVVWADRTIRHKGTLGSTGAGSQSSWKTPTTYLSPWPATVPVMRQHPARGMMMPVAWNPLFP